MADADSVTVCGPYPRKMVFGCSPATVGFGDIVILPPVRAEGCPTVTVHVIFEQSSVTVSVYVPAGRPVTVGVVPTVTLDALLQL